MDIITTENLNLSYGDHHVLHDVTMNIKENEITALIGPSGCGKSTFLKTLNRMNDLVPNCKIEGSVLFHGEDIYGRKTDAMVVRKKIGMVFQKPNPFPVSIYDNVAYAPRYHGTRKRVADKTAFFFLGNLIEFGDTQQIFESPEEEKTKAYVSGQFG